MISCILSVKLTNLTDADDVRSNNNLRINIPLCLLYSLFRFVNQNKTIQIDYLSLVLINYWGIYYTHSNLNEVL